MSTDIQWTDETWNPVTGCTKVSPGCAHCYAEGVAKRFWAKQYPPVPDGIGSDANYVATWRPRRFTDVLTHTDRLDQPLHWKQPRRIFVNSMSDLFHEDVTDEFIDRVFAVMALAPRHTFQVLTKRAERMRDYMVSRQKPHFGVRMRAILTNANNPGSTPEFHWPLPNVWLGVSVENQHFADERIPLLLQTPAVVRFISAEPLLGPVDLTDIYIAERHYRKDSLRRSDLEPPAVPDAKLDWVIVGGESGPLSRVFEVAWARLIVKQCQSAGVPVFVKQLGSFPVISNNEDCSTWARHVGKATNRRAPESWREPWPWVPTLKDRKGGDMAEWPEDLRVREFPA